MKVQESSDSNSSRAMTAWASRLALSTSETIDRSCVVFIKIRFNVPGRGRPAARPLQACRGQNGSFGDIEAEPCFVLPDRYQFTGLVTTRLRHRPLTCRRCS